jgi:hypothetical protein
MSVTKIIVTRAFRITGSTFKTCLSEEVITFIVGVMEPQSKKKTLPTVTRES